MGQAVVNKKMRNKANYGNVKLDLKAVDIKSCKLIFWAKDTRKQSQSVSYCSLRPAYRNSAKQSQFGLTENAGPVEGD